MSMRVKVFCEEYPRRKSDVGLNETLSTRRCLELVTSSGLRVERLSRLNSVSDQILTVESADPVAKSPSSNGEKSKSVTRSL
jgi:hypothetical protein